MDTCIDEQELAPDSWPPACRGLSALIGDGDHPISPTTRHLQRAEAATRRYERTTRP